MKSKQYQIVEGLRVRPVRDNATHEEQAKREAKSRQDEEKYLNEFATEGLAKKTATILN